MNRLEELTLMIKRGWGDVPQTHIPNDWQKFWGPGLSHRPPSPHFKRAMRVRDGRWEEVAIDARRPERRDYLQEQRARYRTEAGEPEMRRAEYISEKACLFSPGSQFRFPFSFSETG
jgi:hypothetical protein